MDTEESLRFEVAWWRVRRLGYLLEVHALRGVSGDAYEAFAGPRDGGVNGPRRFLADGPSRLAAAEAGVSVLADVAAGRREWPDEAVVELAAARR